MEALLKELSDQKQALDQAAIVAATDRTGAITYVNNKFCEVSEYSQAELIGQNHRIINSGVHPKSFFSDMWNTVSTGNVWRGEVCNKSKSGRLYWVDTTIVPFMGEDGLPYQFMSIRHEITAFKEAQQTILEQQARLIAASKLSALGEVAAAITHEINNPLGVILGRCEMLREMLNDGNTNTDELKKMTEMIEITGRRIEKIVKSMRTFTHGSESEMMQPYLISEIVTGALDLVTQKFRDHGIGFSYDSLDPKLEIFCRPTQILQILVNLLNNAHDAAEKLSERWVRLEIITREDEFEFRVIDSGKGISPAVQQKLFTPFFTTKDIQYGTGLGLSISKRLAEKQGGSLELDFASPNTCFVLNIPRKPRPQTALKFSSFEG